MKTILILAGKSRRFWPLSEKPLFPILGKTLAEHQVDALKSAGLTDLILVVNKENKAELSTLYPKTPIVVQEGEALGMHRAFLAALPLCKKEAVLLVSGNDFIDPSAYKDLQKEASGKDVSGALLAYKVSRYFPGGYLTVKNGQVTSIIEKPGEGKEPSDLVNIVAHVHNDASRLLEALKKVKEGDDGYERALDSLLKTEHYRAVPYEGPWQPVKYSWHLLPLLSQLLGTITKPSIHKKAIIHPTAVIEGNVIIEEGVRILPHATVKGPCYIGTGSIIGNNALVRDSSIGENCVVGFGTEVKGSILAGPVWTHMTYLGDSVVGRNVSFGGGCMTGNLRLDESEILSAEPLGEGSVQTGLTKLGLIVGDNCRFGIHVGTNPGVKVGSGTFVSGGIMLGSDIPEESFVKKTEAGSTEVRKNKTGVPGMGERKKYFR